LTQTGSVKNRVYFRSSLLILFFFLIHVPFINAQIIHTPVNTALGGGGTAYTTGYESLFINPANLFIQEKEYRFQIAAGTFGTYLASPIRINDLHDFWDQNLLQTSGFSPVNVHDRPTDYRSFIDRNYSNDFLTSAHQSKGEIHWIGMHWSRLDKSYAFAVRTRYSNRFITGRNYYDQTTLAAQSDADLDRSLNHQFQVLHELSFGYAESFSFINGLIPQLSQLIVGIAPKFVVSGAYLNTSYTDYYRVNEGEPGFQRDRTYQHYSTGVFTEMADRFRSGLNPYNPAASRADLLRPTGYGAGLDLGLTYLITLGDDLSVVRVADPSTRKSLRISLSITDIGFIYYTDTPRHTAYSEWITRESDQPGLSDVYFLGRPGEQYRFLDLNGGHPIMEAETGNRDTFSSLLPTAIHAGLLFQISRLKLMGDVSFTLVDNAFNSTRPATYLGTEIRLLSFIPLRAGLRITPRQPDYVSFGTGLETKYFDLNIGIQFRSRSLRPDEEITGLSMGSLKFYIP
jgi:hypothetical protein